MIWQRKLRLVIAVLAIAFSVVVGFAIRRRPAPAPAAVAHLDPNAVVESTGAKAMQFRGAREDFAVESERQIVYADGTMKLIGVKITVDDRDGHSFTVTGKEGQVGHNQSHVTLHGGVELVAADGLHVQAEHASYDQTERVVQVPGAVTFTKGRMTGSGLGATYDKSRDVLSLAEQAVIAIAADGQGAGAAQVNAGTAALARREHYLSFDRDMKLRRQGQIVQANSGIAYLTEDDKRISRVELRGAARITAAPGEPGSIQALSGRNMTLKYGADGEALEQATLTGDAVIQVAGGTGRAGRRITAGSFDVAFAPDGTTPTALLGRDSVMLVLPPEQGAAKRVITSSTIDAKGRAGQGLTAGTFTGNVDYREQGGSLERRAQSSALDVAFTPGLSTIEEARFTVGVRFEEGTTVATSGDARYLVTKGMLELRALEGQPPPRVTTDRIAVDARHIDLFFDGPKVNASGDVRSVIRPDTSADAADAAAPARQTKLPSMFKQDQPVNVTAGALDYDGAASRAVYSGKAQLWQGDTTIAGDTLTVDDKTGDLLASGSVRSSVVLNHVNHKTNVKEKFTSLATSKEFRYEDAVRRATYTTGANMNGPQGSLLATRIELYLKEGGDDLERIEAYDAVTLRDQGRVATGARMSYFADDERYVVTGAPVTITETCRETTGKTVTLFKASDRVVVDGQDQYRTQTRSGDKCADIKAAATP